MIQVFNVYKFMVMSDLSSWIYIDPVISVLSELPDVNCTPCSLWWPVLKACSLQSVVEGVCAVQLAGFILLGPPWLRGITPSQRGLLDSTERTSYISCPAIGDFMVFFESELLLEKFLKLKVFTLQPATLQPDHLPGACTSSCKSLRDWR